MARICETILYEAQRSGAMKRSEIIAGARLLDRIGYLAIEVMPPPTGVNTWEQISAIRKVLSSTPVLISVNVEAIPREHLRHFIESAAANGVDIFRLKGYHRDSDRVQNSIEAIAKVNKIVECTIQYSKEQNKDSLIEAVRSLRDKGCNSLCINDRSGIVSPNKAVEIVSMVKQETDMRVTLRVGSNPVAGGMAYYAAANAGVDGLYCMLLPALGGEGLPDTKIISSALKDSDADTGVRHDLFEEGRQHFSRIVARAPRGYEVEVSGNKYHVFVRPSEVGGELGRRESVIALPRKTIGRFHFATQGQTNRVVQRKNDVPAQSVCSIESAEERIRNVTSTMEGIIVKVLVQEGDNVKCRDTLLILEAMKMQNQVLCPVDGVVEKILVSEGESVKDGQDLIQIRTSV